MRSSLIFGDSSVEYSGLSSVWEIDIYIGLMFDLGSIYMSSYRFTPAELKGFRRQLTGLQFMRYVRLSMMQLWER